MSSIPNPQQNDAPAPNENAGLHQDAQQPVSSRPWLEPYRWRKGESGNIAGKRKGTPSVTAALKDLLSKGATAKEVAQAIIDGVVKKRDPAFAKLLLDRCDGVLTKELSAHIEGGLLPAIPTEVHFHIPDNHRPDHRIVDITPRDLTEGGS